MADPRLCIIGAGHLSTKRIYPNIGAAGGQLVGVCDLDSGKAERNARRFGGRAYTDMDTMLDVEKPDAAIVCVGPHAHAQLACKVLRRGLPVYTEKPPAMTSAEALTVAQTAKQTQLLCTTAFKKRYAHAYSRAKQWIDTFDPDDLYSISIDYASAGYPNTTPEQSFLLDFAIHAIDLIAYLFGNVAQVVAIAKGPNAYAVSLRFTSGAVGSMNLTDGRSFNVPTEEVEITARGGNFMTISNSSRWRITQDGTPTEWREPQTFVSGGDSGRDTGHLAELEDFIAALDEGRSTRSCIAASYKSMVLYEAIRDSAQTGTIVPVQYQPI